MEPETENMEPMQPKTNAPYAVASLVLGILSIVTSCGICGLILSIIGLVLSNKGLRAFKEQPLAYEGEGMLKAGKICSIIGLVIGIIAAVYCIVMLIVLGNNPELLEEAMEMYTEALR